MKRVALLGLVASLAHAGGWISSGGELFQDARNPFFVRNTAQVTYCVLHDTSTFSTSTDTLRAAIRDGIRYWKNEFLKAQMGQPPGSDRRGTFELGSQTFNEVDCAQNPDLRLLFGYGTLSQEERDFLKRPEKYIGVTVRTDYDSATLKGRGFLYFSSDTGEHKYDNSGQLLEKAWEHRRLLDYAILHELGHVFGFPHAGTGLMSEVFLDQLLDRRLASIFEELPIESFLSPEPKQSVCQSFLKPLIPAFFTADPEIKCVGIDLRAATRTVPVVGFKENSTSEIPLGEIRGFSMQIADFSGSQAVLLKLSDAQTVFTPEETAFRPFMVGASFLTFGAKATFIPNSGPREPKPIYFKFTPTSVTMTGLIRNQMESVYIYNSPLSLLLMTTPQP